METVSDIYMHCVKIVEGTTLRDLQNNKKEKTMFKKILIVLLAMGLILPVGVVTAGKGPGGPGGGGGDVPDTGELYGDLYVILRNEYGAPILSDDGCIQPIAAVEVETSITIDTYNGGTLTVTAYPDEPFALPSYIDTAGDEVACELTEEMATWVQAVDFGRLNLGRAPESVIAHAFDEAINKMNIATAMRLDPAGRLVLTLPDTETEDENDTVDKTIDAPAENLALYIKMMTDGHWITIVTAPIVKGGKPEDKGPPEGDGPSEEPRPVLDASAIALLTNLGYANLSDSTANTAMLDSHYLTLAASLFAAAADKTGSITLDKVVYINSIYGINQVGTYVSNGASYFDYGAFVYDRKGTFWTRGSLEECGLGFVWVLQPDESEANHFYATCMDLLRYADPGPTYTDYNAVRFFDMSEAYIMGLSFDFVDNVRAFAQASDDALQVLEYIHNYKVPEVLYPAP
jgi:hypothetical protein